MTLTLSCPGAKTAINKILFASYGLPDGEGLAASANRKCHSPRSVSVVESYCLQQQTCSLWAVNDWFTDECVGTGKFLTVTAQCAAATPTIVVDASAVLAVANVTENSTLSLVCDAPLVVSKILFASYGTPVNTGVYAAKGKCDATNSTQILQAACVGDQVCNVNADNSVFGNPCHGTGKRLTVTALCAAAASSTKGNATSAPGSTGSPISPSSTSSPTSGTPAAGTASSSSTPVIIGVVCGVVVVVAVVVGYICCRRRQKQTAANQATPNYYYELQSTTNGMGYKGRNSSVATGPTGPTMGAATHRRVDPVTEPHVNLDITPLLHHRLVLEDLHVTSRKPLASGAYGEVWLGVYGGQQVAIKRLKQRDPRSVQRFIDEIVLMSQLDSDYVIRFVGASWTRPIEIECVVEYMDLGDLRNYLMTTRPGVFTWSQKYDVILSVIHGLVYLHTFKVPIIHRDLKSRNILLDSVKGTKLTDFGTSRAAEADDTMTTGIGTYQWMAPEIVAGTSYTAAADIYSFGIVLSELCTHKVPYADLRHPKTGKAMQQHYILHEVCEGRLHPTFDGVGVPTWVPEVAKQCLQLNDVDRPTALQLSAILSKYRQSMRALAPISRELNTM
ncbi:TKL protein kinase [Saprolegnia diclina VS20]|uniref:TKL protein kinase n=1 Tax=Saprolegnia diclina (strain VS20) TaxID=1156394 RepID=T0Q2X7_SAPDV|nr:TKL protein kinase [Saprolegnia diclina VS20]EQC27760.1 TKL protein kinase [Saprolegnia diclina VS20]|eukprot:XP_008618865.1 TKL protein kinase [Saprolegnia diclina VS20]